MNRFWPLVAPELRAYPPADRQRLVEQARQEPLDAFEMIGMAAGILLVTAATQQAPAELAPSSRFLAVLVNFALAVPLLAITLGPFQIRRIRRGLRRHASAERKKP